MSKIDSICHRQIFPPYDTTYPTIVPIQAAKNQFQPIIIIMSIELATQYFAIGDQVSITGIPESYFNISGERLFYSDSRIWAFKHNPYIDFRPENNTGTKFLVRQDAREIEQAKSYTDKFGTDVFGSQTEFMLNELGLSGGGVRHPRLYAYEDLDIVPHKVVVHTTGSNRALNGEDEIRYRFGEDEVRVMSDEVIAAILRNYKDWLIVQIGASSDKPIIGRNVVDLRGQLDIWGSAAEIASASRFIGVNSGPMHIANCYPGVSKRIVLMEFWRDYLEKTERTNFALRAGSVKNTLTCWLDPANTYFNKFDRDYGISYSYLKI